MMLIQRVIWLAGLAHDTVMTSRLNYFYEIKQIPMMYNVLC
jgi:hypothetical protein